MAKKELTFSCYIEIEGAAPAPMENLSSEERARIKRIWSERLSKNMSAYYSQHPEQAQSL